MSAFIIFIIILVVFVVLCIVSKCFENSYMARVRQLPKVSELDFGDGVPLT